MKKKSPTFLPNSTHNEWVDEDDAPELTAEWFATAKAYKGEIEIPREEAFEAFHAILNPAGRPKGSGTKDAVYVRLDKDLLEHLRATGKGWQTRLNGALRKGLGM